MIGESVRALELATTGYENAIRLGLPDEAVGFAQQIVFQHLDDCDDTAAEHWLRRCSLVAGSGGSPARDRAVSHAHARLLLQRGQFLPVLDLYLPLLPVITLDLVAKRRANDVSTVAFAAAMCGHRELAATLTDQLAELVESEPPGLLLDYPVELSIRTLRLVGRSENASELGRDYGERRRAAYPRPLSKFCSQLAQF